MMFNTVMAEKLKNALNGGVTSNSVESEKVKPVTSGLYSKSYVGAPYNFVPIAKDIMPYDENGGVVPAQNAVSEQLHTGVITYKVEAFTPIAADAEKDADDNKLFYKRADGRYAIPGSSIRGLVRSNAQILSFSSFQEDIDDYGLMFRDFTTSLPDADLYNKILGAGSMSLNDKTISILKNVRAGYLVNRKGTYSVYGTEDDDKISTDEINYLPVSERYMLGHVNKFKYLYDMRPFPLQHLIGCTFTEVQDKKDPEIKHIVPDSDYVNRNYTPFMKRIRYTVTDNRKVSGIQNPNMLTTGKSGYLVGSGTMNEKKLLYVIPAMDESKIVMQEIPKSDIDAYLTDYNSKLTRIGRKGADFRNFYSLPKDGEEKPVFYIHADSKFYFGFTPHLRLFYAHSIKEGLLQESDVPLDYARAIFGYIGEKESRKGRVEFEDAVTDKDATSLHTYILGAPHPSSFLDYVVQTPGTKAESYNTDEFKLRGIKQYWNKERVDEEPEIKNRRSASSFYALPEGSEFSGKVHFRNLTDRELGLLLYSLELESECHQQIGFAKPYGFGQCQVTVTELKEVDVKSAYDISDFHMDPYQNMDSRKNTYINAYKQHLNGFINKSKAEKAARTEQISSFLDMKKAILFNEEVRYMKITKTREYANRKQDGGYSLPKVDEIINSHNNKLNKKKHY